MIASRSIAHGLYHFCLLHDFLQKRRNFSADPARDMVSRNFGPDLFARGITAGTCDDLTPFLAHGTMTANLPRFLENTAKIEIGPWTAPRSCSACLVARLRRLEHFRAKWIPVRTKKMR
jgi:hypothetical protein